MTAVGRVREQKNVVARSRVANAFLPVPSETLCVQSAALIARADTQLIYVHQRGGYSCPSVPSVASEFARTRSTATSR